MSDAFENSHAQKSVIGSVGKSTRSVPCTQRAALERAKKFYKTGARTGFYRPDHVPTDEELMRLVLRK